MAWIDLTQDRDRWRALVNAVMSLQLDADIGYSYGRERHSWMSRVTEVTPSLTGCKSLGLVWDICVLY